MDVIVMVMKTRERVEMTYEDADTPHS